MKTTPRDVFLFVPNLICYLRIILALVAFYVMKTHYIIASSCYILVTVLDEIDGMAARMLKQCSKFGGILDLLIDISVLDCFLAALASFYPQYSFWFLFSIGLDIISHWMQSHASTLIGHADHKDAGLNVHPVMRFYNTKSVLTVMCIGNGVFWSMVYVLHFTEGPQVGLFNLGLARLLVYACAPIPIYRTIFSFIQLAHAATALATIDAEERSKEE